MRNRKATLRRLSVEQQTVLGSFGNLLSGSPGESCLDTAVRLFGTAEAASDAWFGHRGPLLAADPIPGRRPAGFWLFERRRDVPPVALQPDLLRDLGLLTELEEATLRQWAAMVPEQPVDVSLDRVSITVIDPTPEEPNAIDPTPEPARPQTEVAPEAAVLAKWERFGDRFLRNL